MCALAASIAPRLQADPVGDLSPADFGALDLVQLAAVRVDIASIKSRPVREQPGIVSVIQAADIRETGARDLTDILQMVPGFGLGSDVNGVVGPSFRGLWAYEGKMQIIVDGVEMNETLYGSTQFGHHISADAIEQVEIIRGPGSAKYGGTAELAVVRVTTKGATQNGGFSVMTPTFVPGRMSFDYTGGFGYTRGDWRVSANAFVGDNFRSDKRYNSLGGSSFDMKHASGIEARNVDVGVGWKEFDLRFIWDSYHLDDRVNFGEPLPKKEDIDFDTIAVVAKYDWKVNDWLTLTPSFTWKEQTPWHGGADGYTFEDTTESYNGELTAVANLTDEATLLAGFRYHRDEARAEDTRFYGIPPEQFYNNGMSDHVAYDSIAPYAQLDWDSKWFNLTLGGRYEYHSAAGGQFVPRVGVTKAWERFHLKAIFDRAYRTPNINIINSPMNGEVESEKTTAYQLEAGYQFDHGVSLVENVFYMQIRNPIVYSYDPVTLREGYINGGSIGSYGSETELRWDLEKLTTTLGYSLYLLDQNTVSTWQSGNFHQSLGIPTHKITASTTWHIRDNLSWNLTGIYTLGGRAYFYPNTAPAGMNPVFLLNTYIEYRWKHASLGLGAANLLNMDNYAIQPYNGGSAPLPLKGREIFVKLGFSF
jgi:outer membrane receptor protein involved in Fe transport